MKKTVSYRKVIYFFLMIGFSAVVAYYGQPAISGKSDAINVLVTIYSVLAGILIAIITLIGDPAVLDTDGSWRKAYLSSKLPKVRLLRLKFLFHTYLVTLLMVFLAYLIPKDSFPQAKEWVERLLVFFACVALLSSFRLPGAVIEVQRSRLDKKIAEQRKKDGINDAE
ncbi:MULTISPECIES: hypothetical protein [Pectobacterium]|uniref:hypothetical protein n=1 Tax=Pectobacterium TaxID=122277 RepID=UPI001968E058|nr:hypothetical protein [Pectobacterium brasiliense]MBN3145346.1 hypothetical protein [Pectobacterium brasiliense]